MGSRAWWAMKGPGDFDPPERPVMTEAMIGDQVDAILLSWSAVERREIAEELAADHIDLACARNPDLTRDQVIDREFAWGDSTLRGLMWSHAVPQAIAELEERGYACD